MQFSCPRPHPQDKCSSSQACPVTYACSPQNSTLVGPLVYSATLGGHVAGKVRNMAFTKELLIHTHFTLIQHRSMTEAGKTMPECNLLLRVPTTPESPSCWSVSLGEDRTLLPSLLQLGLLFLVMDWLSCSACYF